MIETIEKLEWNVSGEANEYTLMSGGNWLAMLRLNGEMLVEKQLFLVRNIVASANACAHIPLESLESGDQINLTMRAIDAERQRDEALARGVRLERELDRANGFHERLAEQRDGLLGFSRIVLDGCESGNIKAKMIINLSDLSAESLMPKTLAQLAREAINKVEKL